ncbi:CHRD domain-containing protein [Microcella daejeonensis]|uniref:CHRD domain-containing protein n=1 Tax=Microcella daejeonensis TaxID=2994971 RepID=UPI00226EDBDD|nr:CHRD domain-containing protein [Microcella daejeonensis]WAB85149.1 CHRD domain-containing protein [Microcella daejeonensis]
MIPSVLSRSLITAAAVAALVSVPLVASAASVVPDGSSGRPLSATLLGANEVGPAGGDPDATGTASVTINVGKSQLCYDIRFTGVAPIFGHVHDGAAGANGDVVITLSALAGASGVAAGCETVDRALLREMLRDPSGYYVNFHSSEFPGGAIRGQLGR